MPDIKVNQRDFFFFFVSSFSLITCSAFEGMCLFSSPVTYAAVKGHKRRPEINSIHRAQNNGLYFVFRYVKFFYLADVFPEFI